MLGPIKARADLFGVLMRLAGPRVIFRDGLLLFAEHIHSKTLPGMKMGVRTRPVIHTNQNQQRLERYRGKRVRGHAVDFTVLIHGDHRDPGRERSHGLAEFAGGEAHAAETCGLRTA